MIPSLLLALTLCAPQAQQESAAWQRIDGVAMHIGNRIVSFKELEAAVVNSPSYRADLSNEDFSRLTSMVIRELTNQKLEQQAGEDAGLDPERVSLIAQQQTSSDVERVGAALFSDQLRTEGASIDDLNLQQSDLIYSDIWRSKQLGLERGWIERPSRDRYIRPGMLKSLFRVSRDSINPGSVEMRFFVLSSEAVGGEQAAIDWLEGIKRRVAEGADFAEIVISEASEGRANGGLQPEMVIPQIAFPDLRDFAANGEIGEFGPIISLPQQGTTLFLLARLESRKDQVEPKFEDGALQNDFRRRIRDSVDTRLLESAHERLFKRSHVWFHPDLSNLRQVSRP